VVAPSTEIIRVVVAGATGRVGSVLMAALPHQPGVALIGGFGSKGALDELERLAPDSDILVDFTTGQAAPELHMVAVRAGLRIVSGTSGLPPAALDDLDKELTARNLGGVWAANFAVGAVLMMHFARLAAPFMDAAEVIELHHDRKVDAPSGTAIETARQIREARDADLPDPPVERATLEGARGAVQGGVRIHSVRLPGLVGHQEVLFGTMGQLLEIRHDAMGRDAYVPGVVLAIKHVMVQPGLTRGLDTLMGLQ
jgi:4-hydroxy-tetrahydrodipicolinate reductase